jgi:5-dehydro-2-deoxygluconokinase
VTQPLLSKNKFLVLGRAGLDLYADPPGCETEHASRFSAALGGSAANIAAGIVKLGGAASLITTVSDDAVGRFVMNQLQFYGIANDHVRVIGGEVRTSLAVVETRAENCQSVIYRNGAADFELGLSDVESIPYMDSGALIVTGTALATEPSRAASFAAIERARHAGLSVVLDVDYRPYSWANADVAAAICSRVAELSDIVIGNDVEFSVMAGGNDGLALAERLAAHTAAIVVYKMGEKGSVTFSDGTSFNTDIFPVEALKPTGAGDAFMAGFVTGLASGAPLRDCVRRGTAAAAIVVTRVGCAPAMPTEDELQYFLKKQA